MGRLCAILAVLASSRFYLPLYDILCSSYVAARTACFFAGPTLRSLTFESGGIIHTACLSGKLCHPIRLGTIVTVSHLAKRTSLGHFTQIAHNVLHFIQQSACQPLQQLCGRLRRWLSCRTNAPLSYIQEHQYYTHGMPLRQTLPHISHWGHRHGIADGALNLHTTYFI